MWISQPSHGWGDPNLIGTVLSPIDVTRRLIRAQDTTEPQNQSSPTRFARKAPRCFPLALALKTT